jgi:hypothetical protein
MDEIILTVVCLLVLQQEAKRRHQSPGGVVDVDALLE